jgi:cephalosporin hydroxylase
VRYEIDDADGTVRIHDDGDVRDVPLYSPEGFGVLSDLWVKVGWDQKYPYTFSWLGRPIIQLPEDIVRLQEVVWHLRPAVILETGIAHGGSAVFLAGLCRLLGHGRVVAVDIEIRPHNRAAIEAHPLKDLITLIEGNAVAPEVVEEVHRAVGDDGPVLVILDSDHSHAHVLAELEAYAPLVTVGSWIVATDGVMRAVADVPRGNPRWSDDNPITAAQAFLASHPEFALDAPSFPFNESDLTDPVTHWPESWLRRIEPRS